jgi:hypothetical protein
MTDISCYQCSLGERKRWEVIMAKVRSGDRTGAGMYAVNDDWLRQHDEPVLEPDLPIVDPHHHLWDRDSRYLLDELLDDVDSGHNVRATVFIQCRSMYRAGGPAELALRRNAPVCRHRRPRRFSHGAAGARGT